VSHDTKLPGRFVSLFTCTPRRGRPLASVPICMKAYLALAFVPLFAACGASAGPGPEAAPPPPQEKRPAHEAANAEWAKILEEALKNQGVAEQQRVQQSLRHYELALAWFNKGDFEKAKVDAQKAVQVWPENLAARKLLSEILEIIVGIPGGTTTLRTPAEADVRVTLVKVEQTQLEITMHLVHGQRYFDAKMYGSALKEFENAEFKIVNMPWEVKAMNDLLPRVRANIVRAKNAAK